MPHFASEPALPYSQQNQTAVLLLNLGTPDAPTTEAVRAFLKDFVRPARGGTAAMVMAADIALRDFAVPPEKKRARIRQNLA